MNKNIRLNYLILCDDAFLDKEDKPNIIATFDSVDFLSYPATYPKASLIGCFSLPDPNVPSLIAIVELYGTDDKKVEALEVSPIKMDAKSSNKDPNGDTSLGFVVDLVNIPLKEEGVYTFKVLVGGDVVGSRKFRADIITLWGKKR